MPIYLTSILIILQFFGYNFLNINILKNIIYITILKLIPIIKT